LSALEFHFVFFVFFVANSSDDFEIISKIDCIKSIGLNLNNIINDHKNTSEKENHVAHLQSKCSVVLYILKYAA
jgi:hypothetical protein